MAQAPKVDYAALWKYVTDQVKARTSLPPLWRALEAARAITVENDRLIVGFGVADMHQSGLLLQTQHKNIIEQVLEQATHRRLQLEVIQGETLQDWEAAKQHAAEASRLQEQSREQFQKQVEGGQSWEAIGEQLVRKIASLPHRGLASVQGRFLAEALDTLVEAYGRLMPEHPTEADERGYSRTLERLSERVFIPASLIAYLVDERRKHSG
ncbi:MAG TPA: hypothetical protein VFU47_14565 [Armatimonadota bacterium]|nr:hypothetical protein [Armatimonadota bacterium]